MRKHLILAFAIGAATLVCLAGVAIAGEKATVVRLGNLELTINGGVTPKTLPKHRFAPITLHVEGGIATTDGTQPPALKEVIVDTDKNGQINPKGLASCSESKLQATDTKHAEEACKAAIIGTGTTNVTVAFPEQTPIPVSSKLVAFNGGTRGQTTTIYIHAYLTVPIPAAIVTTVKITKEHKGAYGLRSIASVPKIAGGNGSVTSFSLTFHKLFTYKGHKQSYFVARCANGRFLANAKAIFANGESIEGGVVRTCKSKG